MNYSKADVHIHTDFSDGLHEPEAIVNYVVTQTNLRVIAITDHNTIDGAKCAYDYWQSHRTEFDNLEVIKGVEVSSSKGHILGLFVHQDIPAHMSPADTIRAIHEQGGLAIAAHPFTHLLPFTDFHGIGREISKLPLDGVETRSSVPTELYANWITDAYNRNHGNYPALGSSDAHYLTMVGKTYTLFPGTTAEDFRQSVIHKKVKAGGRITDPLVVLEVMLHLIRRRRLPIFLPTDRQYRRTSAGLTVDVVESRHDPSAVLYCSGEIVRGNAEVLKAEAARLIESGLIRLVVDLTLVNFVDSAGLGAIIAAQKRACILGGDVSISAPGKAVALTLRMVRLDKVLNIYDTATQALAALCLKKERLT